MALLWCPAGKDQVWMMRRLPLLSVSCMECLTSLCGHSRG